jgi:hypothetical protein
MLRAGVEVMIPEREVVGRIFHVRRVDAQAACVCQFGGEAGVDYVAGMKDQIASNSDHARDFKHALDPSHIAEQHELKAHRFLACETFLRSSPPAPPSGPLTHTNNWCSR